MVAGSRSGGHAALEGRGAGGRRPHGSMCTGVSGSQQLHKHTLHPAQRQRRAGPGHRGRHAASRGGACPAQGVGDGHGKCRQRQRRQWPRRRGVPTATCPHRDKGTDWGRGGQGAAQGGSCGAHQARSGSTPSSRTSDTVLPDGKSTALHAAGCVLGTHRCGKRWRRRWWQPPPRRECGRGCPACARRQRDGASRPGPTWIAAVEPVCGHMSDMTAALELRGGTSSDGSIAGPRGVRDSSCSVGLRGDVGHPWWQQRRCRWCCHANTRQQWGTEVPWGAAQGTLCLVDPVTTADPCPGSATSPYHERCGGHSPDR
jgi:hypothetical protein